MEELLCVIRLLFSLPHTVCTPPKLIGMTAAGLGLFHLQVIRVFSFGSFVCATSISGLASSLERSAIAHCECPGIKPFW